MIRKIQDEWGSGRRSAVGMAQLACCLSAPLHLRISNHTYIHLSARLLLNAPAHIYIPSVRHGSVTDMSHGQERTNPATPRNQQGAIQQTVEAEDSCMNRVRCQRRPPGPHNDKLTQKKQQPFTQPAYSQIKPVHTNMKHGHRDAPACTRSSGGRPLGTCTHTKSTCI